MVVRRSPACLSFLLIDRSFVYSSSLDCHQQTGLSEEVVLAFEGAGEYLRLFGSEYCSLGSEILSLPVSQLGFFCKKCRF